MYDVASPNDLNLEQRPAHHKIMASRASCTHTPHLYAVCQWCCRQQLNHAVAAPSTLPECEPGQHIQGGGGQAEATDAVDNADEDWVVDECVEGVEPEVTTQVLGGVVGIDAIRVVHLWA